MRIADFLKRLWHRFFPGPEKSVTGVTAVTRAGKREESGAHYYLGDLLGTLDSFFESIHVLRRTAPDDYDLLAQAGIGVVSKRNRIFTFGKTEMLTPHEKTPSFACVYLPDSDRDKDRITPIFIYIRKEKRPVNVEATNQPCYRVGVVYYDREKPRFSAMGDFSVALGEDGSVRILRVCRPRYYRANGRSFARMEWTTWPIIDMITSDKRKQVDTVEARRLANEWAVEVFRFAFNSYFWIAESGLSIRVRKRHDVATFAIDMLRTPYFFADREKTVNQNGKTKRIFHIVRTFRRSDGTVVKSHFRGLRKFVWNGYDVSISLGEKHHAMLLDFDGASQDDLLDRDGPMVSSAEAGRMIDRHMEAEL